MSRTHDFPRVIGYPPAQTVEPAAGGSVSEPPREPRETTINESAEDKALPLIYGERKVGGLYHVIGSAGDSLVVQYLVGSGPLQAFVSWTLNGYDSGSLPSGVNTETFLGAVSPLPSVSTLIQTAVPGYPYKHPGVAQVVASYGGQSEFWGGIAEFLAIVRGRRDIYDPRLDVTPGADPTNPAYQAYTTNPALIAAHMKTGRDAGGFPVERVTWDRIASRADWFAKLIDGQPRYSGSAVITERANLPQAIGGFLACFMAYEVWDRGQWYVGVDGYSAPVAVLGRLNLVAREVNGTPVPAFEETALGPDEVPEAVVVSYPEPKRGWEMMTQTFPPALPASTVNAALEIQAAAITDASQAARLAEETFWQRRRSRRFRAESLRHLYALERGDIVDALVPGLGLERNCVAFDGVDGIAEVEAAGLELTGSATVELRARVPAATGVKQILVDRYGTGYGYALLVNETGYLEVRYGGTSVVTDYMIADGVRHHIALVNEAGKKLKVFVDCALIAFAAADAGAAAGTDWTSIGARHGGLFPAAAEIEEVRLWSVARTPEELEAFAWRSDVPETATGLVACWSADEGSGVILLDQAAAENDLELDGGTSWVEHGEQIRVQNVVPKPDGGIDLEFAELGAQSFATATVLSTGDEEVDRVTDAETITRPDPAQAPSPPSNLVLTVIKRIAVGVKPFAIKVQWDASPSGFVRGYEVTLDIEDDAETHIVGQYARHATECLIEVIDPAKIHAVTVYAVAAGDVRSTGVSDAVTPGALALTIAITDAHWFYVRAPIQEHDTTNGGMHDGIDVAWSVSDDTTPSSIQRIEVYQGYGGSMVLVGYAADPTWGYAVVEGGNRWGGGLNSGNLIGGISGLHDVQLVAVLVDGRMVVSSIVAATEHDDSPFDGLGPALPTDALASVNPADSGHSLHPAIDASPPEGGFYHYSSAHWKDPVKNNGTVGTDGWSDPDGNGDRYIDITFAYTHKVSRPYITLGATTPNNYWTSDWSATGFRLWAGDPNIAVGCDWMSEDPL